MVRTYINPSAKRLLVRLSEGTDLQRLSNSSGVGKRTISRARSNWRRFGRVDKPALIAGRRRVLGIQATGYVLGLIAYRPDIYLQEIQRHLTDELQIDASVATIHRTIRRAGYTLKQTSKKALERDIRRRSAWIVRVGSLYKREQLVFVDESACDRRTTYRRRAWAYSGARAQRYAHFVRGKRYSILPALSLDGILHVTVIEGAYTEAKFTNFIQGLLLEMNPFPGKNSVLVMDNAIIHKSPRLREIVEEKGVRLEYLPPYSPDFNPIEEAFSCVKSWIRRNDDWTRFHMGKGEAAAAQALIYATLSAVTPAKVEGWFLHAGYGPSLELI